VASDIVPIRRALISVSDKEGVVEFARALASHGAEILSTGGTAEALRNAGLPVASVESLTGYPEMLGGRVKTLHPAVHGALLGLRDDPGHREQMSRHDIRPIDLLCVNLYPFEQTVARPGATREEAIENIDIGGPAMIRSAAKNHASVAVVTSPAQYTRVTSELSGLAGATSRTLREELAREAFALTSRYDAAIASYLSRAGDALFPPLLSVHLAKDQDLRYGENPHQAAAVYRHRVRAGAFSAGASVAGAEQLHGKELSYNNIADAAAALDLVVSLMRVDPRRAGACVVKHTNPCGCAVAPTAAGAADAAIVGDPVAAYGGIFAANAAIDADAAERLAARENFFEVIVAPEFSSDALAALRSRWANVRLLRVGGLDGAASQPAGLEFRSIAGGVLVQERDTALAGDFERRAGPAPTPAQLRAARFLEATGRSLFSNAVLIGGDLGDAVAMFGAGAGQMDRVTSCRIAVEKAGARAKGAVAYSDAFFPFADGPGVLIGAGVSCIVHAGGSKRDQETFDACERAGVACLTTGLRHFRH